METRAGKENETDCVGRVTETIWSRSGSAAHPKTWSSPADVPSDLLHMLRVPHDGGEVCEAAIRDLRAKSALPPQLRQLTLRPPHEEHSMIARIAHYSTRKTLRQGDVSAADLHALDFAKLFSPGNRVLRHQGSERSEPKRRFQEITPLASEAQSRWNFLQSSCPLFARKFDTKVADVLAKVYRDSVVALSEVYSAP